MNLDAILMLEVIEQLENYLEKKRPPLHIRPQLDISYRIDNQSVYIFEIRPAWNKPEEIQHIDMAKTTFVKSQNIWKVFWMRGNGNWENYQPKPSVESIKDFLKLVTEDKHACFWG
jgi:hypothetical protein